MPATFNNEHVRSGLTWDRLRWAFRTMEAGGWHPFTWLSSMLDVELFGLDPGRHHLMSVFLHVIVAAFFFIVLQSMTGEA